MDNTVVLYLCGSDACQWPTAYWGLVVFGCSNARIVFITTIVSRRYLPPKYCVAKSKMAESEPLLGRCLWL